SINGHDRVEAQVPVRYLQDTFLPSYAGGVDGGAGTVMINSGSVDGIPATASRFLMTEELRGRLGFRGVIISDFGDVPALATAYPVGNAGRDVTLQAARESVTLLRNQGGVLPLSPSSRVVVTGPSADSMTNQLGGWSVSWQGVFGAGHVCCMGPANQIPPGTTV